MGQIQFELDFGQGYQVVAPPRNYRAIKLEMVFTNPNPSASIQSINFEWVNTATCDNATKINAYRDAGLSGGTGIGEGIPLRITACDPSTTLFEGVIDTANPGVHWECDKVIAPIKKIGSIDWFNDLAQGITFSLLHDAKIISPPIGEIGHIWGASYFYKRTPFIISYLPDGPLLVTISLEIFVIIQEFKKEIKELKKTIKTLIGDTANIPPTPAKVTIDIINMVTEIIYAIVLFIAIGALVKQLIEQIIQFKKYKYCMRAEDLINAGIKYINTLGTTPTTLQFSSSILADVNSRYKNTTIMPGKRLIPSVNQPLKGLLNFDRDENEIKSINSYGYPDTDLKTCIDQLGQVFNATCKIRGNKLEFEEVHHWNEQANFVLPNVDSPQYNFNFPKPDSLNWSELAWNYLIRFQLDSGDEQTRHRYRGTTAAVNIAPVKVNNALNLLPPPSVNMELPFALAKRKEYLNFPEQLVNELIGFINTVGNALIAVANGFIQVLNAITSIWGGQAQPLIALLPTNPLLARIGWLELSSPTFDIPKIFIGYRVATGKGDDWELLPDLYTDPKGGLTNDMSAIALMQNFHGKNLMTRGNQWVLYRNKRFPMCCADFVTILNNNIFTTADSKYGKFEKILWNVYDEIAESVDYRVNETYTKNISETSTIDGN